MGLGLQLGPGGAGDEHTKGINPIPWAEPEIQVLLPSRGQHSEQTPCVVLICKEVSHCSQSATQAVLGPKCLKSATTSLESQEEAHLVSGA